MKTFQINNEAVIVCDWKKTRTAFKHEATLLVKGQEVDKTKICYLNRTWEAYEFESVIKKLLDKTQYLNEAERKAFLDKCAGRAHEEVKSMFGAIGAVALMGEIFHAGDQKAQNDWKARMLKAGLQNKGLIMPDDWETLDENTKQARLDGAIAQLTEIE